ncbi:methyl-accepting chemotaxis protein II [Citrobacter freundii]|nr:methyl-accepting chemotaxis protein II [Citrobacter freundii]
MFNRIRVVTMLMMVLGVFALLQLVSGGLLFSSLQQNQQSFVISNDLRQQQSELTSTWDLMLQTRINLSRSSARMMMDASNQQSSAKNDLLKNAKASLAQAETHYAKFKNMTPLPEMAEASGNVEEKYQQYHAALAELVQFLENGNMDAYFAQPTQGMQNALGEALGKYASVSEKLYVQAFDQSARDYHFAQWQLGVLAVVLVLILVVVWYGIRHTLLNPLSRVIAHIREIASGNLTVALAVSGRNEIGELASTVDHMQRSLTETVTLVREGSDAIYSGTSEIASGNTDLSSRTEQQASALEETAASMEQLTATVKQNADNARQASQLAKSASDTAQHGGKVVDSVVNTMHEIADIISVIDGIAFQTNILALNAAVEAARAGEQGRGFAVVAGEVRNLASRSAQAAKEIKALIEDSVSRVDTGSVLVESAGETMNDIVNAVTRVTDIMGEIASASDEQSRGIDQVALAVSEMDRVTQQNASLVQESAAAAAALEEQASRLTQSVSTFRLASRPASTKPRDTRLPAASSASYPRQSIEQDTNWETF